MTKLEVDSTERSDQLTKLLLSVRINNRINDLVQGGNGHKGNCVSEFPFRLNASKGLLLDVFLSIVRVICLSATERVRMIE